MITKMTTRRSNKTKAILVRLTEDDYEKLAELSVKVDIPMAVIARQTLKAYLNEQE